MGKIGRLNENCQYIISICDNFLSKDQHTKPPQKTVNPVDLTSNYSRIMWTDSIVVCNLTHNYFTILYSLILLSYQICRFSIFSLYILFHCIGWWLLLCTLRSFYWGFTKNTNNILISTDMYIGVLCWCDIQKKWQEPSTKSCMPWALGISCGV